MSNPFDETTAAPAQESTKLVNPKRHNISITHEFYEFLQGNAVGLNEAAEDVIRRLLKMDPKPDLRKRKQ